MRLPRLEPSFVWTGGPMGAPRRPTAPTRGQNGPPVMSALPMETQAGPHPLEGHVGQRRHPASHSVLGADAKPRRGTSRGGGGGEVPPGRQCNSGQEGDRPSRGGVARGHGSRQGPSASGTARRPAARGRAWGAVHGLGVVGGGGFRLVPYGGIRTGRRSPPALILARRAGWGYVDTRTGEPPGTGGGGGETIKPELFDRRRRQLPTGDG